MSTYEKVWPPAGAGQSVDMEWSLDKCRGASPCPPRCCWAGRSVPYSGDRCWSRAVTRGRAIVAVTRLLSSGSAHAPAAPAPVAGVPFARPPNAPSTPHLWPAPLGLYRHEALPPPAGLAPPSPCSAPEALLPTRVPHRHSRSFVAGVRPNAERCFSQLFAEQVNAGPVLDRR